MNVWQGHDVEGRLVEILAAVPIGEHHFGRPYMTAYQLAIEFDRQFPDVAPTLGVPVGGAGVGVYASLASYLARELSQRIKKGNGAHPVEGAFLSGRDEAELRYRGG